MANLLLIDDDPDLLPDQVNHVFPAPAHHVEIAKTGAEGLQVAQDVRPDVILLDLLLPDQSGLEVLRQLRQIDARIPVVLITVARSADSAIEAMRQGAYDFLLKPLDLQKLDRTIGEALKVARVMREPPVVVGAPPGDDQPGEAILGSCPAMQEVYKAIGRIADQTFAVLITGESGTGKELVARAIYQHGPRAKAPFLALNCAAIPETLLESELFGHEKGAFTGADRRRIGKFEQVSGGTLFLDEVGDSQVEGSLSVHVWKEKAISVAMAGTVTELRQEGDTLIITGSEGDLDLWVPGIVNWKHSITTDISVTQLSNSVTIEGAGDVELKEIGGDVTLRNIAGNVELVNVRATSELTNIGGDLRAASVPTLLARKGIGGNASLSDVARVEVDAVGGSMALDRAGTAVIHTVGDDLDVHGVEAMLRCNGVGGDCRVQGSTSAEVTINNVGGNLQMEGAVHSHMGNVGGNLNLQATFSGSGRTHFHVGGDAIIALPDDANVSLHAIVGGHVSGEAAGSSRWGNFVNLVYGDGAARLDLIVGGNMELSGSAIPRSGNTSETWNDFGLGMANLGREMGKLGREIGREMAAAFKGTGRSYGHSHVKMDGPSTHAQDRAAILRMVAEGHITPEEGEMLLEGLED